MAVQVHVHAGGCERAGIAAPEALVQQLFLLMEGMVVVAHVSGKPVTSHGIGRFRERLTRNQVAIIERECAAYFRGFGYQATAGPIPNAD